MARILIIDDELAIRRMLHAALERAGHEVIEVSSGAEGLRAYRDGGVDLVITDILMPDMEGLECILELRRSNPAVRIIAMSGGSERMDMDVLHVARRFGALRSFSKPFPLDEMLAAVTTALEPVPPGSSE